MDADGLRGASEATYSVPGFVDREYILHVPPGYDAARPLPVLLGFHGGGGDKDGFVRTGCPNGDSASPQCLTALADREGFVVVIPDGVDAPGLRGRSWNAGGGEDGFRCVGGLACSSMSDDVAYVDALLAEVRRALLVDDARIYATGMSNGAAMTHRLACERASTFAAIATVSGANQASASPGCRPSLPMPILHIHGTEDPCWGYDGHITEPLCGSDSEGLFVSVDQSMTFWRDQNGCTGTREEAITNITTDGTLSTRIFGNACRADTEHIRIEGGGHAWPDGEPYLDASRIGRVPTDFNGNELIWAFLSAHTR
jgi:polyhydroxybutyrate depolymerase